MKIFAAIVNSRSSFYMKLLAAYQPMELLAMWIRERESYRSWYRWWLELEPKRTKFYKYYIDTTTTWTPISHFFLPFETYDSTKEYKFFFRLYDNEFFLKFVMSTCIQARTQKSKLYRLKKAIIHLFILFL